MKFIKRIKITSVLVLALLMSPFAAQAGFITLSPTTIVTNLNDGDFITMDILIDFTAEPTIGGGFDIVFDPLALGFQNLLIPPFADPLFFRPPDLFPGLLSGWAFGDFNGLTGSAVLGSITFQVLSTMGASTSVSTQENLFPVGPFVSAVTFRPMPVTFNSIDLTRASAPPTVPEPSTLAIFALGIMGLASRRFKKK
ncbi:PEP-CTERM sorting domain-containing protein [Colwellia sp. Arc7-D]|uniref:PEP-CTERM sorting domain-containing protein n=1 Tax=Colwellia sp. Arc7-D TaxID=2161872 RepID=UPI001EF19C39|nr:PEP-CTERM sorting domain-containing protein [Colwellia sp. Arc7-D]